MKKILVTGGAGFIGSHFIRHMLTKHNDVEIINLDKLTYAGNLENLKDIENDPRYRFIQGDICDNNKIDKLVRHVDIILNFAAESHVDRSIGKPDDFIKTDIYGVFVLLEASKKWSIERFVQISTDEVYGSIEDGQFEESASLMPSSPYAASKAGIHGLTRSLAADYAAFGIRANCIIIGTVYTPMVAGHGEAGRERRRLGVPLRTEGTGWDVAYAALYFASDESRWVTGAFLPVDGGFTAIREWPL